MLVLSLARVLGQLEQPSVSNRKPGLGQLGDKGLSEAFLGAKLSQDSMANVHGRPDVCSLLLVGSAGL